VRAKSAKHYHRRTKVDRSL